MEKIYTSMGRVLQTKSQCMWAWWMYIDTPMWVALWSIRRQDLVYWAMIILSRLPIITYQPIKISPSLYNNLSRRKGVWRHSNPCKLSSSYLSEHATRAIMSVDKYHIWARNRLINTIFGPVMMYKLETAEAYASLGTNGARLASTTWQKKRWMWDMACVAHRGAL